MKKGFIFISVALVLLMIFINCCPAFAGVANTQHDMYAGGRGADPNVCSYCHTPHNAAGEKIWSTWANEAQLSSGPYSQIGNMCYTCHDGTITSYGQTTAFNTALQQHKTATGTDCNMCHTVHDNTNGKFVGVVKTSSAQTGFATYCETCHDSTMYPGAEPHGDHLAGTEHKYTIGQSCNSCHQMHGAINQTTPQLTNPILKYANADNSFCVNCHTAADYVQAVTDGNKHPARLAAAGTWGNVGCQTCHDVHQPAEADGGRPFILKHQNIDSAYCQTCHQATGTTNGPAIGQYKHPVGVAFATIGATPAANAIDDNLNGPDYPSNTAVIACETCHSAHKKGVSNPLLRISAAAGALCINCHPNK